MKLLLWWAFTLLLVFVWIFYVVLSIHSKKFSKFSTVIDRNLKLVFIFLLFLSISWYAIIIFWNLWNFDTRFFWDIPTSAKVEKYDIDSNTNY